MEKDRGRIQQKTGGFGHLPTAEPEFPSLTALKDFDRQEHIQKSLEAGLTREQAEKHADEHEREWSPRHIEERER